jgi:hypothetical protein
MEALPIKGQLTASASNPYTQIKFHHISQKIPTFLFTQHITIIYVSYRDSNKIQYESKLKASKK